MIKKIWMLFSVLLIASMLLVACGTPSETVVPTEPKEEVLPTEEPTVAPTEAVVEPTVETTVEATTAPTTVPCENPAGTLTIWADDTRAPILQDLAPAVCENYSLQLDVVLKSSIRDDFQVAAPVGEGPDIIVIAHDQAGTLVENALLAPVDLGGKSADFAPKALEACTFDGVLYCMPYATENMGFFYNTDLVATPPTTWDEVVTIGEALKAEGKVDFIMALSGTTYDIYPLDTAFGGYIFGQDDSGNWDTQDLGLDSEGMIAATKWVGDNVAKGNLPSDTDWANNHALFETGKVPFIMAGPWALDRIRESAIPYAVTNFPSGPAGEGYPFAGTQGFFINSQSPNVLLAQAFLTELVATEETMLKLYEAGQRPPAYLPALAKVEDQDLVNMAKAGENATMMPAIPEMGSVWGNWSDGVTLVIQGKQTADVAMKEAATKVRSLISGAKAGMVNVPGSYQAQAGCPGDWQPDCDATAMTKGDDGLYRSGPFNLTAGDYEAKVAMDGAWTLNYGMDGKQDGDNYKFTLAADGAVSFEYDPATHILTIVLP
jgi:maltose-binding protein MalE